MDGQPQGNLSISTLAGLLALRQTSSARRAAPVTHRESAITFSATCVTGDSSIKSIDYDVGVTHARMLPPGDELDDAWEERAAILEYDGGWPRAMAEAIAMRLLYLTYRNSTAGAMHAFDRELIEAEQRTR